MIKVLPITKEGLKSRAERFTIDIKGITLRFRISWNNVDESFFFDLRDKDFEPIILGRKIVYFEDMLGNIHTDKLPDAKIIPIDFSGRYNEVTYDNFMEDVKPFIFTVDNAN